jgi:hypothetical protein
MEASGIKKFFDIKKRMYQKYLEALRKENGHPAGDAKKTRRNPKKIKKLFIPQFHGFP